MAVIISAVEPHSKASRAKLRAGDVLLTINGHSIEDVLDYRFYTVDERLELGIKNANGDEKKIRIRKKEYEELGLQFDTYLMDRQRSCKNRCVFCFIDQLPKGMRESLYFKDDDARLSFLFGNYITLTNLEERDVQRIIDMHISPINVSVHTTNPQLRVQMMKNPRAGEVLQYLRRLADAGILLNCQLVLCPGINDGEELQRSMRELTELIPSLQSCAAVPVGLTKYREGLAPLEAFNQKTAAAVIDQITAWGDLCLEKYGSRVFYASDEFYLQAGRELPHSDFYEDFAQIENGVGLWSSLRDDFLASLEKEPENNTIRHISIATGTSSEKLLVFLVDELRKKWHNLTCDVYAIENDFFGHQINVSGLVTGGDLLNQLKGFDLGQELLIPRCMLRQEDEIFLDDLSLCDVQQQLSVPIRAVSNEGDELLNAMLGRSNDEFECMNF